MRVDLVDHGQEVVSPQPATPMNLIHTHRLHTLQFAVGQTPLHEPFYRAVHGFPVRLKHLRRLPPAEPSRPARQKSHHGTGDWTLALIPGDVLDDYAMLGTLHSPRSIEKVGANSPQRHKLPAPLRQAVVAWCRLLALRATPAHPAMRLQLYFDHLGLPLAGAHPHFSVYESHKMLYSIEDSLNL